MIFGVLVLGAWILKYLKLQVMIRFLFCFFLSCVSLMPLHAQERVKALCFYHINGSIYVSLKNEVTLGYPEKNVFTISANDMNTIILNVADIGSFRYVDIEENRITNKISKLPQMNDFLLEPMQNGWNIIGIHKAKMAMLFTLDGKLVKKYRISDDGTLQIITSHLASGVYLVKISNYKTIKIQKQ